jgi:CRISPR-associated protein Cas5d
MSYGITLRASGDYALFTRLEMKAERVSYDVMTPSAARGILEAIYWKPQIRWVVDRIHVLAPVRFTTVRRNEVGAVASAAGARSAMKAGSGSIGIYIEEERQQRAAMVLRDVDYLIEAHFEVLDHRFEKDGPVHAPNESAGKHLDMFRRRARAGQCFQQPYFGCREFPVRFSLVEGELPKTSIPAAEATKDFGFMLHDIEFDQDPKTKAVRNTTPRFFRAQMTDGVIPVPPFHSAKA